MFFKKDNMPKVAIVGAGLTGLSLAYSLERQNFFDYEVFEADAVSGGLLKSVVQDGFTVDHTGHFLHVSDPLFASFLQDVVGLENCNKISRSSHIFTQDRYIGYPFQQNIGMLPLDVAYQCLEGFINRKSKIKNPKNFQQWVMKYFGKGFADHFFFPYNTKLLNITPKKLMPSWTGRFVPQTTLRNLTESLMGNHLGGSAGYNATFYYPKTGGIASIIAGISKKILGKINHLHRLVEIDQIEKRLFFENGNSCTYDLLVTTAPLPCTLKMLNRSIQNYGEPLNKLKCNSVFNFNLGIDKPAISEKHWVYLPEKKFMIYRLGFWHNFSENMAPAGTSALYGEYSFLNNKKQSQRDKSTIFEQAVAQTLDFLNLSGKDVIFRKDLLLDYAYVVYDAWREKNLAALLQQLASGDIYSIGRFGEWKYSSMQEAFLDGLSTSQLILSKLQARQPQSKLLMNQI